MKEHDSRIDFRLPSEHKEAIEQLIREGKFKNLSQVMRAALKELLKTA